MIYAKVDVKLRDHVRAHKAGVAMGTWLWALLYAREQETDGLVPEIALRLAWAGEKEARRHAETLVAVGLWERHEDGWRICRYDSKNETKAVTDARRREVRDRVAKHRSSSVTNVPCNALHPPLLTRSTAVAVPGSGSGSGSDLGRDPEPDRSPTPRRFETGTAAAVEAVDAYQQAVAAATGKTFALPRAPFHAQDLCALLNAHAPPGPIVASLGWLGSTIEAWVSATDRKYAGGWTPAKLLDWLNADRPERLERRSAAEITRQPFEADAPWMKIG